MRKLLLLLILLTSVTFVSIAQIDREVSKSVKVYFRQGSAVIDESYMGNKVTLKAFADEVKVYCQDSTTRFRRISVVASASPEGSQRVNDRIAKLRAQAIANWISREISVKLDFDVESTHIDWDALTALVEQTEAVPYRDEVLNILRNVPIHTEVGGVVINERYAKLRALRLGVPYQWLLNNLFPKLRYAAARAEFWWEKEPRVDVDTTPQTFVAEGGNATLIYKKNVDDGILPEVKSEDSWVENIVVKNDTITYDVARNPYKEARNTKVVVSSYGKSYEIPVSQEATVPVLTITSPSPINFPAEGGKGVVTFERNVKDDTIPAVKSNGEWVVLEQPAVDSVAFTVAPNPAEQSRTTDIAVECYDSQYQVIVNQEAAAPQPKVEEKKPFYMALKTNMLYDVALVPNLGVEFSIGKRFSIAANYNHAWWSSKAKNLYWRYYGADATFRWWFGKQARLKPLQGHHIGASYQILTYDFQLGNNGIMAGLPGGTLIDRPNHVVALEYGYSVPIARRLNIDFAVGVGYHWGIFEEYTPIDGHNVWQATKRRQYIGPTKLEVSLVWLIGRGNYNEDKGKEGKR